MVSRLWVRGGNLRRSLRDERTSFGSLWVDATMVSSTISRDFARLFLAGQCDRSNWILASRPVDSCRYSLLPAFLAGSNTCHICWPNRKSSASGRQLSAVCIWVTCSYRYNFADRKSEDFVIKPGELIQKVHENRPNHKTGAVSRRLKRGTGA